jgi:hypothetical protein
MVLWKNGDLIMLDVRYIDSRGFAKGWILLRDIDHKRWVGEIEALRKGRFLLLIDECRGSFYIFFQKHKK